MCGICENRHMRTHIGERAHRRAYIFYERFTDCRAVAKKSPLRVDKAQISAMKSTVLQHVQKVPCLPQNRRFEVYKMLCVPRSLHFEAPATKSPHQDTKTQLSRDASPKYRHVQSSRFIAAGTKSEHTKDHHQVKKRCVLHEICTSK